MQFFVNAYDGTDAGATKRRMDVRENHLALLRKMVKEKKCLYAAAILDNNDKMIGSLLIVDFPSKEALEEEWLKIEPYVVGDVWRSIDIKPCKVPDFCLDMSWIYEN